MKRRVLLMVLIGISLVLAVMIRFHQAANVKLEQSLAMAKFDRLSKVELVRFQSDLEEFYQSYSKVARDEQKRLRRLYNQIQNDPENERLTKTMEQYVDWVNRFSDPPRMREIQTLPINERVVAVHNSVMEMRRGNVSEQPFTLEFLKETIRDNLPPELRSMALLPLFNAFDDWLTKKYDDVKSVAMKSTLNEQQINYLPEFEKEFEKFYRDLFLRAGIETSPTNNPGIPEKLAMIQLFQNLNGPPRGGGVGVGGFPRFVGGPRPGGGGGPFPFEGSGLRGEFLRTIDEALDRKVSNDFLDRLDPDTRRVLGKMDRPPARMEALQGLLALAVLERYPKADDLWRSFFQVNSREEQDWIKLLGNYLSMMTPTRREEFLKPDSRYTMPRLQRELMGNARTFFSLLSTNRDRPFGIGPPLPMPPSARGDF